MRKALFSLALAAALPGCVTDMNGSSSSSGVDAGGVDASVANDAGLDGARADGATAADAADGATAADADADAGVVDAALPDAASPGEAGADASGDDAGDAGAGTVTSSQVAATQLDLVGKADQAIAADGEIDGTIDAHLVGPITGLVLLTTDASGAAAGGQEWDTLVVDDPIPASIGAPFSTGSQTWVLGVAQGTTLRNGADGRLALGAGAVNATIVASDSGYFVTGQHFRLWARDAAGAWSSGPVFVWP